MSAAPTPQPANTAPHQSDAAVMARLSTLDRFLPVWILSAMVAGLILERAFPGSQDLLDAVKVGQTSLPVALGLLMIMYPVLAKVHDEDMGHVTGDRPMLWSSWLLNWVTSPRRPVGAVRPDLHHSRHVRPQGEAILNEPLTVALIAMPLLGYFVIMWGVPFAVARRARLGYPKTATLAFTAAGNNSELAIAVSIGVWGVTSGQALAGHRLLTPTPTSGSALPRLKPCRASARRRRPTGHLGCWSG